MYVHNREGLSESEHNTVICNLIFVLKNLIIQLIFGTLFCADELPSGSESAYLSVEMISVCHFLHLMIRSADVLFNVFDLYFEWRGVTEKRCSVLTD